jgi:hypothetical protein
MKLRGKLHTPVTSAQGKENQVAPMSDLDSLEKRKVNCPCHELKNIFSIVQPITE